MNGRICSTGMPGAAVSTTVTKGVSLSASTPTGTRATEQMAMST
jgi:hypothetical protein